MSTTNDQEIGTRIMLLRNDRGFTREYLSEKVGITSKFLYEIEVKGKGFSTHTLMGLSSALGVSTDYLLLGEANLQYDKKLADTIGMFKPQMLESLKKLLEVAYELAIEAEK